MHLVFLFILKLRFPASVPISHTIRGRYGPAVLTTYRRYETNYKKLEKAKLDLHFLNACIRCECIPKFLKFKLYKHSLQNTSLYRSWQKKLLQLEIEDKQNTLNNLKNQSTILLQDLRSQTSFLDFIALRHLIRKNNASWIKHTQDKHETKLKAIGGTSRIHHCDPDKVIFNLSDRVLTVREKFLLSFGLDFGLPIYRPNFYSHFLPFESLAKRLKDIPCYNNVPFSAVTSIIKDTALSIYNHTKKKLNHASIFNTEDYKILKNLGNDSSITVSRPDKGRGVVILNRTDYVTKMNHILSDTTKFKKCSNQDSHKLAMQHEDKINRLLRKLKQQNIISTSTYNSLFTSGSGPGILYGLPKIHKTGTPLRPILAAYNTAAYKIAKFIVPLLEPYTHNSFSLPNSYALIDKLKEIQLNTTSFLCSFDVQSLFTNIPLDETIDIICNTVFQNTDRFHNFPKTEFRALLNLAAKNPLFIFNKINYTQTEGCSMGSPVGGIFANFFLAHHEKKWLEQCPTHFKPVSYYRYVDDTLTIFNSPDHANKFLDYLNQQHANITFTLETESNGALPFLDCLISKQNNRLSTSIYRKQTFTGLGTSFYSNISHKFKINAIKTLVHRAYHLSSSFFSFDQEINFLRNFFTSNGYPVFIFDTVCKKFLDKIYAPSTVPPVTVPKMQFYFSAPYYNNVSEQLIQNLTNRLSVLYPQISFLAVNKNYLTIGKFFKFKDEIPACVRSSVIYKFSCGDCNASYLGCTRQRFKTRIHQHLGTSERSGLALTNPSHSEPRNHAKQFKHNISAKK